MDLGTLASSFFETRLRGRYITLEHILPILEEYKTVFDIQIAGKSEKGKDIPCITTGNGDIKVLIWSQMHGNESTTTKALFDWMRFLHTKSDLQQAVLSSCSIKIIPILNPDGAEAYTRENANAADLNRDAVQQTQTESRVLRKIFEDFRPSLCLNMHDQRTIYSVGNTKKPATVSFLAPSANTEKTLTKSRKKAMFLIAAMQKELNKYIPGQTGRYDDSFNKNCVGDFFQATGATTILFEAGHYQDDYQREKTRSYIHLSLVALFNQLCSKDNDRSRYKDYFSIPENTTDFRDICIKNAKHAGFDNLVYICIQFEEKLENQKVAFIPKIDVISSDSALFGHYELDALGKQVQSGNEKQLSEGQVVNDLYIGHKKLLIPC